MLPQGMYHLRVREDQSTDEHFAPKGARIRVTPTAYLIYCAPCDAVTLVPKGIGTEDERDIEAAIESGFPTTGFNDDLDARGRRASVDPLVLAREDGESRIPSTLPTDHNDRRALAVSLR